MRAADIIVPVFLFLLIAPAAIRFHPPNIHDLEASMQPVKLSELQPGDIVFLDDGFTCRDAGPARVFRDCKGDLYVGCRDGRHVLDGQDDGDGVLVGVSHPPAGFDPSSFIESAHNQAGRGGAL